MKLTRPGLCAFVLASLTAAMLPAAEVPIDQRLPEEVVLLFTCPDGAGFGERFAQTNFGQMLEDPALADFRADIEAGLAEALEEVEAETGMAFDDLLALIEGEIAFAVVAPRGEPIGIVAMLEYGTDNEDTMDEIIGHMQEGIKESEPTAEMSVDTIEGVEVTVYEFETEPNNPFNSLCYFRNEGQFCITSSPAVIESILIRWDGSNSSTLAEADVYSYIMEKCAVDGRAGDVSFFIDPIGLMNAIFSSSTDFAMAGFLVQQYISTLGLDTLHGFGGTLHMATEEFDTESHMFLYADQPPAGVFKVFSCTPAELAPPTWVAADVQGYQCINWDIQAAYSAVESMYDTFNNSPGAFATLVDSLDIPGGLHLKSDIVDLFSGRIHVVANATDPADVLNQQMLFALEIEDEAGAQTLVDTFVEEVDGQIEERDFQGTTIYEPAQPGPAGAGPFAQPAFAIHAGMIVIGSSPETVEGVVRPAGSESPLSESKSYLAISKHLPDEVAMLGYAESESQIAAIFEMARSGELDMITEGAIDFSSLPEFSELAHYFTPSASYAIPDDNGALFVGFGLKADASEN